MLPDFGFISQPFSWHNKKIKDWTEEESNQRMNLRRKNFINPDFIFTYSSIDLITDEVQVLCICIFYCPWLLCHRLCLPWCGYNAWLVGRCRQSCLKNIHANIHKQLESTMVQINITIIEEKRQVKSLRVSHTDVCEELECLLAASEEIPLMVSLLRVLGLNIWRPGNGPTTNTWTIFVILIRFLIW